MDNNTMYYNQGRVVDEIYEMTHYPKKEIVDIFNSLSYVLDEMLSDTTEITEIKFLPGYKIIGKVKSKDSFGTSYKNITNAKPSDKLTVNVRLSDDYKRKVNSLYKNKNAVLD